MRPIIEEYVRSLEARAWDRWSGLLAEDVVYEEPQTRERVTGRDALVRLNRDWVGEWHLSLRVAYADESGGGAWIDATMNGEPMTACVWFTFDDGLITSVTDFWPEPYEPPTGREHLVERY